MSEYPDESYVLAIGDALKARDMEAVVGLLRRLAVQNPRLAQQMLDTVQAGVLIAKAADQ